MVSRPPDARARDAGFSLLGILPFRVPETLSLLSAFFVLAMAPEGTRSYAEGWRSGFYHVAVGAGVPLGVAHFDYASRRIGVSTFLQLSGEPEADMAEIAKAVGWAKGYRPQLAAPIRLT